MRMWKETSPRMKPHLRSRNCFLITNEEILDNHEYHVPPIAKRQASLLREKDENAREFVRSLPDPPPVFITCNLHCPCGFSPQRCTVKKGQLVNPSLL